RNDVRLHGRKAVALVGEAHGVAVGGEDLTGHVVVAPHRSEGGRVGGRDRCELRVTVCAWLRHRRYHQIVDHPSFVPAALVVDDEESRDVGENVDEGSDVIGIGRQAGLGLEDDSDSADGGEITVGTSNGQHRLVVHARYSRGEDVPLEALCIKDVVLEEL